MMGIEDVPRNVGSAGLGSGLGQGGRDVDETDADLQALLSVLEEARAFDEGRALPTKPAAPPAPAPPPAATVDASEVELIDRIGGMLASGTATGFSEGAESVLAELVALAHTDTQALLEKLKRAGIKAGPRLKLQAMLAASAR